MSRAIIERRLGLLAFFVPFCVYALTLNGIWSTDYPSSILGLQWSLWANHSFSLGPASNPMVQSVDVGIFNGNSYSEISPGFAIIALPFAVAGFLKDGNTFSVFGHALLADELFLALCSAIGSFFVYRICRFYSGGVTSLLGGLTFAVATPLWPLTTVIFIQGASVMFSTASLYFFLRYIKITKRKRDLIVSGFCLGIAAFVEYMVALFVLPLLAYLLIKGKQAKRSAIFFGCFSIAPFLWLLTNSLAFSNPLIFPEQLKSGAVLSQFELSLEVIHAAAYIASPYRGILVFSPVLALGFFMLFKMSKGTEFRVDAYLFLSLFFAILLGYSGWRDWAGGLGYGPRFLLAGVPYIAVPISLLLTRYGTRLRLTFFLLFAGSMVIEGVGAFTTAFSSAGDIFNYQLSELNLPWFFQAKFDTWWFGRANLVAPYEYWLVAFDVFVLIAVYCYYWVSKIPRPKVGLEHLPQAKT